MKIELIGKRAVVSGAARGIGQSVAVELCRAGADVVISDLADTGDTEKKCKSLERGSVHSVTTDVSDPKAVADLMDQCVTILGGLDIVVSNAAYSDRHSILTSDLDEMRKTVDVSMWGAFYMLRFGAEKMVAADGGNIVIVSSPHAHLPIPGATAYNMAKAGCDQMAKTAACELARENVRVNLIHPGHIDTPGERKFFSEAELTNRGKQVPLGRLGLPDEIARGVLFLCHPSNSYITGSTLTIDGGIQLPWGEMSRLDHDSG